MYKEKYHLNKIEKNTFTISEWGFFLKAHTDMYMKSPQILEEIFDKFGYNKIENFYASDETTD